MTCAGLWLGMSRVAAAVHRQASFHDNRVFFLVLGRPLRSKIPRRTIARLDFRGRGAITNYHRVIAAVGVHPPSPCADVVATRIRDGENSWQRRLAPKRSHTPRVCPPLVPFSLSPARNFPLIHRSLATFSRCPFAAALAECALSYLPVRTRRIHTRARSTRDDDEHRWCASVYRCRGNSRYRHWAALQQSPLAV